jgi:hypothetical protein
MSKPEKAEAYIQKKKKNGLLKKAKKLTKNTPQNPHVQDIRSMLCKENLK